MSYINKSVLDEAKCSRGRTSAPTLLPSPCHFIIKETLIPIKINPPDRKGLAEKLMGRRLEKQENL